MKSISCDDDHGRERLGLTAALPQPPVGASGVVTCGPMSALNGCGLSGSMRSAAGGDAAGEGVIPGVNCGETGQLGEPDGRDGDQRMEPKIAVAAATPCTVLTIDTLRCRESCVTSTLVTHLTCHYYLYKKQQFSLLHSTGTAAFHNMEITMDHSGKQRPTST
ncbi:unnamed protein product [Urochloa humidicola]